MSKSAIEDVFSEINDFYMKGNNLGLTEVLMAMQIARLDRIADALESIDQSLQALSGCIGPTGSFCIAGDVISSEY